MKKINTILIGLGKIGFGYQKNYMYYRSHSFSLSKNPKINFICAIDSSRKCRKDFEKKFKLPSYDNIEKVKIKNLDLVVIASDTKNHYLILDYVLHKLKPKVILCEKPFTTDSKLSIKLHELSKKKNVKIFVNYNRHSLPSLKILKNILKKENGFWRGNIIYSGSVLNSGSHFIELLINIFGDPKKILSIKTKSNIKNLKIKDLKRNFEIKFKKAIINFKSEIDKKNFYYINLYGKKIIISWKIKSKICIFHNNDLQKIDSGMKHFQKHVYKEIENYFKTGKANLCSSINALKVLWVIKKLAND